MRIAVPIRSKNYYRLLGPVVEEALRRGHEVDCHQWSGPAKGESPFSGPPLEFREGTPRVLSYRSAEELAECWRWEPPDAVVSIDPPGELRGAAKSRWLWLQYGADMALLPEQQGFFDADAVAFYSAHWRELIRARHRDVELGAELDRKSVIVGAPELDAVHAIDRESARQRLGLPADRPVVLYLPFPLHSNPRTSWLASVYRPSTRIEQAVRLLATGHRQYWRHAREGRNDRRLVEAARRFCDRNGALLVMKARDKDWPPRYASRLADRVLGDESHHPPTILELMRVASLCVHFYSTAAMEAAYCGVPSLCLAPEPLELAEPSHLAAFPFHDIHNGEAGGIYNAPGVAYWRPLDSAFDGLGSWSLADFPLDGEARRRYVEAFLGSDDGRSAGRLIDALSPAGDG